ncbi:IS3 family transposase [Bacillus thuringiensis]|uniref:IS3 family transposase n=1 Tax=Bacillus thuringiensis TaxID=1428 RepID=UPI0011A7B451
MIDKLDYKDCQTFESLELNIKDYIEEYNYNRYQWTLKKMTPDRISEPSFKCLIF